MATGLANDLQTLMKLFAVALGEEQDKLIIRQGSSTVGMLMLRLLSGRLWEGWNLLKNGYEPIEPHYETDLSPDARAALGELRIYFAKRGNLIATVRDKIGFHADSGIVKRAFERMADDTDLGAYLCRTIGNTLYYSAELIHYEAINGFTGGHDQPGSLRVLVGDVQRLVGHFNTFIFGFARLFLERHLGRQLDDMRDRKSQLDGVPHFNDLKLPFFTELTTPRPNPDESASAP
jgi:hypothetical protein